MPRHVANEPTAQNFLAQGQAQATQFATGPNTNLQSAGIGAGANLANLIRGSGATALGQSLASLNQLLSQQGALDPRILAQLTRGVSRGTQQSGLGAEQFAARSGIRGQGQAAIQSGIANAGADRQVGLEAQLAQQQQQTLMQLIGLTTGSVTNPGIQFGQIGQNAQNQQAQIEAQRGDPFLQALGFGAQGAATFFGGPAGGQLLANKFPSLFGDN